MTADSPQDPTPAQPQRTRWVPVEEAAATWRTPPIDQTRFRADLDRMVDRPAGDEPDDA